MSTTPATSRRAIVNELRMRHHRAYMIATGAPMDSIVCRECYQRGQFRSDDTPLTHEDLCVIFHAEGSIVFPVCDACGKDLGE